MKVLLPVLLTVGIVVVLAVGYLGAMKVRRTQLRRTFGTFEGSYCRMPSETTASGAQRWVAVVFRYEQGTLQALRLFSVSPLPMLSLTRTSLEIRGWANAGEAAGPAPRVPRNESIVVELDSDHGRIALAMTYADYTGLSSWLEAGPVAGVGTWRQDS